MPNSRHGSPTPQLLPIAIGLAIGGGLSLLGTPLIVVLLLAGLTAAYALGWRIRITQNHRIIDL